MFFELSNRLFNHRFLSFAKNMSKDFSKNISKNISGKDSRKLFDHAKQFAIDALKIAFKKAIQKTAETTSHLIGNKIADKITRSAPEASLQTDGKSIEKSKEEYISQEKRQKNIDEIRLLKYITPIEYQKINKFANGKTN